MHGLVRLEQDRSTFLHKPKNPEELQDGKKRSQNTGASKLTFADKVTTVTFSFEDEILMLSE